MTKPLIEFRGLDGLARYFADWPDLSKQAATLAINSSARQIARLASKKIREQVAFTREYIGDASNSTARLRIKQWAKSGDIQAVIAARERPTSLARFALGAPSFVRRKKGMRGPRVRVKTGGGVTTLKRGFFVKLKGAPDSYNVGLAIRLPRGETLASSQAAQPFGGGAYLLYGPSVAQVFETVREDVAPDAAEYAASEFFRQFSRLSRST